MEIINKLYEDEPCTSVFPDGEKRWLKNGILHRDGGPAVVWPDGSEFWHKDGSLHREDGSAVVYPDGVEYYYLNGRLVDHIVPGFEGVWARLVLECRVCEVIES